MKLWTISEITERFQIEVSLLQILEEEDIICPILEDDSQTKLFPDKEVEKLRIAKVLIEEMDVNLAGVEVVLRMRNNMIDMRRQFDIILDEIAKKIQVYTKNQS